MNSIINECDRDKSANRGQLYSVDSEPLANVYYEETENCFMIHILEQYADCIPSEAFLVSKTKEENDAVYRLSLNSISLNHGMYDYSLWIGHRVRLPEKSSNIRKDLRIPLNIEVVLNAYSIRMEVKARIRNISAGGMSFVSETRLPTGLKFSVILPNDDGGFSIDAEIVNQIPTTTDNILGYGCKWISLDAMTETKIRQFVFKNERHHNQRTNRY